MRFRILPLLFLLWGEGLPAQDQDLPVGASPGNSSEQRTTTESLMQREVDRRKENTFRYNEILDSADRLFHAGEWDQAKKKYGFVRAQTFPQGPSAGFHRRARVGIAKCLSAEALQQQDLGKPVDAANLMRQASAEDPDNSTLAKQAARMQEEAARVEDPFLGNPAATEDLVARTSQIKKLFSLADQLMETGQYQEARNRLDDVIRIDPYNRVARKKIETLEAKRLQVAGKRYLASREKALAKVTEAWLPPPPAKVKDVQSGRGTQTTEKSNAVEIFSKLRTIRIPELVFNQRPIREAVEELQVLSEQYDPDRKGLNFVLRLPPAGEGQNPEAGSVTFELADLTLESALSYVCMQVVNGPKLRYEVENNAVLILPVTETGGRLETRSFDFPATLVGLETGETDPKALGVSLMKTVGADTDLEGSSAVYFKDTGKLVVRSLPNELNKVELYIRANREDKPQNQFEVEAKFLQFSENDLKNLTFNLQVAGSQDTVQAVNPQNPLGNTIGQPIQVPLPTSPGVPNANFSPVSSGTDGLRGTAGLNPGGGSVFALQQLLDPNFPQDVSNQVNLNMRIFGRGFAGVIQFLQNALGKDIVAAPRVTLADGKDSKIVISRRMFYPTSYTSPTVNADDSGVGSGFILPSNPTGFEPKDIGVTLKVKAESTPVTKAVDLEFSELLIEDFKGFIDYGTTVSTITTGTSPFISGPSNAPTIAPTPGATTKAPFLVPIFSKKSLQTRLRILDGETVVIGGLIGETTQEVNDKVPGLGDLPLVGRLFRSEVSQKIKTNLLIFTTVRIVKPDGKLMYPEDETNPEFAQNQGAGMIPAVP